MIDYTYLILPNYELKDKLTRFSRLWTMDLSLLGKMGKEKKGNYNNRFNNLNDKCSLLFGILLLDCFYYTY